MVNENLKLTGYINFVHKRDGKVIETREVNNLITTAGKGAVAGLLISDVAGTAFDYIAIGIGITAAAPGDTTLGSEIVTAGGQRRGTTNVTGTRTTTTVTNDTSQLVTTFTFTGSFAVTEAGILNAASTGTLLARQVFTAINVVSSDTLTITWKIVFS